MNLRDGRHDAAHDLARRELDRLPARQGPLFELLGTEVAPAVRKAVQSEKGPR